MKRRALHAFLPTTASMLLLAAFPAGAPTAATPAAPSGPVAFEVATIRPNKTGERARNIRRQPGGRMTVTNMPLRDLIGFAYQVNNLTLVGAPDWTRDESFNATKAPVEVLVVDHIEPLVPE